VLALPKMALDGVTVAIVEDSGRSGLHGDAIDQAGSTT
jgi:hypothetical protein